MSYFFTSESVSAGHPDKVADQISDAILDSILEQDENAHVACETMVTTGLAVVSGEVTTTGFVDVQGIVRKTINEIGYNNPEYQFAGDSVGVLSSIHGQSPDIAMGVDKLDEREQGAGDQGIMFGYAVKDGINYMPLEIMLSRKILEGLDMTRTFDAESHLRPDAKAQVTIEYDNVTRKPIAIDTILVSVQHDPFNNDWTYEDLCAYVKSNIVYAITRSPEHVQHLFNWDRVKVYINPTGNFVIGGPAGDTGLTGRKIVVDTYGGHCPHGGGAFSGKDPSKVDRSAAYMCRYVAKNLVAAGVCDECTIQVSYAIGVNHPLSVFVDTHNTSHVPIDDELIAKMVQCVFDITPYGIIKELKLKAPIYQATAKHGHFGVDSYKDEHLHEYYTWEKLDKVEKIKKIFCIN